MDIRKLQRAIVDGLEDVKGQDIVVFNTEHLSPLFERVIIASGTSNRQTKSLAASVRDAVKAAGGPPPRVEGEGNGEWIIVDCGAAVVHVMQPTFRDYYHLEELWGDKPVRVKLGAGSQKARGATVGNARAEADESPPPAAPAKKVRARAAAKKPAPRTPASRSAPSRARSAKTLPTGTSPARKGVTRTVGVKSGASAPRAKSASPVAKSASPRTKSASPRAKPASPRAERSSARPAAAPASTPRRNAGAASGAKKAAPRATTRKR